MENRHMKRAIAILIVLCCSCALVLAQHEPADVQAHIDAATRAAGKDWATEASFLCSTEQQVLARNILPSQVGRNFDQQYAAPAKIFDDFYFVGLKANAYWVITTSA